jgi:plastocyanin
MLALRPVLAASVLVALAVTGCASSGEPATARATSTPTASSTTPPASPATTPTPTEAVRTITVSVRDGKVDPRPDRIPVSPGETVRLVVTSDVADEMHVHGYDLEKALPAGQPATLEFVADQPGLFEVETHETEKKLCWLQVE